MIKIAPSILASDFLRLGEAVAACEHAGADRLHLDVMDGMFVPNISFGQPVARAIRRATTLPLEAHLMIEAPGRYVKEFVAAGVGTVIVHQEASPHLHRTVQKIRDAGGRPGVVINPATPAATLTEIIADVDLVLVMTVNPGFGGQSFIASTLPKIRSVAAMILERNPACELEVDGGIDPETAPRAVEAGATVLVAGTAVFRADGGIAAGIHALEEAAARAGTKRV